MILYADLYYLIVFSFEATKGRAFMYLGCDTSHS